MKIVGLILVKTIAVESITQGLLNIIHISCVVCKLLQNNLFASYYTIGFMSYYIVVGLRVIT